MNLQEQGFRYVARRSSQGTVFKWVHRNELLPTDIDTTDMSDDEFSAVAAGEDAAHKKNNGTAADDGLLIPVQLLRDFEKAISAAVSYASRVNGGKGGPSYEADQFFGSEDFMRVCVVTLRRLIAIAPLGKKKEQQ